MSSVRVVYELRRLERASDPDFHAAIRLYTRLIPGSIRTQSNEITYWLDNYRQFTPDEFCVCGFYSDGLVIGYAQFVFFHTERILVFDYLILHEHYRSRGEYLQFTRIIKTWVDEQNWEVDYIVTEVTAGYGCVDPDDIPPLVELLHQSGFAVAKSLYYQPQLGADNVQSDLKAYLMIRAAEKLQAIPTSLFLRIIHTIYFKHYGRWYEKFLHKDCDYAKILKERYQEIEKEVRNQTAIELNGVKRHAPPDPAPPPAKSRRDKNFTNATWVAIIVLGICFSLLLFQRLFDRDLNTILALLVASLLVAATAFAIFYNKGRIVFSELLKFIKPSGKRK